MTASFTWLHGETGTPCVSCGNSMSPRMRSHWNDVDRVYEYRPVDLTGHICLRCESDCANGRGRGTQYRPPASRPSHPPPA